MRKTKQPKSDHDYDAEVLAQRYARYRDDHDFHKLLSCMSVTVENEAKDSAAGNRLLEDELYAVCVKALAYAAETWNLQKGRKFTTWAKVCIRSRLIDAARHRKRHPSLSMDVGEGETVDEVLESAGAFEDTEDQQVEAVDMAARAKAVKSAWTRYAASIEDVDEDLFQSYVFALVAANRLSRSVGFLVLSMSLARSGQLSLFALEQGEIAHQSEATSHAIEMLSHDGWVAATYLLQGHTVSEIGIELVLPSELVQALLDRVRSVAETSLRVIDSPTRLAA